MSGYFTSTVGVWSVTLPLIYLKTHKIQCIKALRAVYPIGLREAKESVERKAIAGEQLFTCPLTNAELLALEKGIDGGTNPIPREMFAVVMGKKVENTEVKTW